MLVLQERVLFEDGRVLEILLFENLKYRLCCGDVTYENDKKKIKGRVTPYEFRSVEQLRYDFEKDLADG